MSSLTRLFFMLLAAPFVLLAIVSFYALIVALALFRGIYWGAQELSEWLGIEL